MIYTYIGSIERSCYVVALFTFISFFLYLKMSSKPSVYIIELSNILIHLIFYNKLKLPNTNKPTGKC